MVYSNIKRTLSVLLYRCVPGFVIACSPLHVQRVRDAAGTGTSSWTYDGAYHSTALRAGLFFLPLAILQFQNVPSEPLTGPQSDLERNSPITGSLAEASPPHGSQHGHQSSDRDPLDIGLIVPTQRCAKKVIHEIVRVDPPLARAASLINLPRLQSRIIVQHHQAATTSSCYRELATAYPYLHKPRLLAIRSAA